MNNSQAQLAAYYERRATQYDTIYQKPERQNDLNFLQSVLPVVLANTHLLELAAGTGYWTQYLARTAWTVTATDFNPAPLRLALRRDYPRHNVTFAQADAYRLEELTGTFTALFAGFWWSHVPVAWRDTFLDGVVKRLVPGSPVVMVDNRYVEGSSIPISRTDSGGNTYQTRQLNGVVHEVMKNFPVPSELAATAGKFSDHVRVQQVEHFWYMTFQT